MSTTRPASHWFAILVFAFMALANAVTAYVLFRAGDAGYVMTLVLLALAIVALAGLGTMSKWARIYCSAILVLLSVVALGSFAVAVAKTGSVDFMLLLPSVTIPILMLVLCYRFAFGQPSRDAFNRSSTGAG